MIALVKDWFHHKTACGKIKGLFPAATFAVLDTPAAHPYDST